MFTVTKQYRTETAHRLPNHKGGCRFLHGHSYLFEVTFEGQETKDGMVVDFKEVKNILQAVLDPWDHAIVLYKDDELAVALDSVAALTPGINLQLVNYIPTAENMAEDVADKIRLILFDYNVATYRPVCVRVWETSSSYAEWRLK